MNAKIADGHDYRFVGRVGQFCPIKPNNNGGILYRILDGKTFAPPGSLKTKNDPYRWLESESVKLLGKEDAIDDTFYRKLVDDAVANISKHVDFEWFVSNDPYIPANQKIEDIPWYPSCRSETGRETCIGCPKLNVTQFDIDCKDGWDVGDLKAVNDDYNAFAVR